MHPKEYTSQILGERLGERCPHEKKVEARFGAQSTMGLCLCAACHGQCGTTSQKGNPNYENLLDLICTFTAFCLWCHTHTHTQTQQNSNTAKATGTIKDTQTQTQRHRQGHRHVLTTLKINLE